MEIFCENISGLRTRLHDPVLGAEKKRQLQQFFSKEIMAYKGRMDECITKARELGITRRYRTRVDFLRMIGMFLIKKPISPSRKKETMKYLLLESEIRILRDFYGQTTTTAAFKARARHTIKTIASNIYITDIRSTLLRCGIPFGFREKEKMVDLLCLLWFGKEVIRPAYTLHTHSSEDHSYECPICTDTILSTSVSLPCACKNFYHSECMDKWSQVSFTCPTCRKDLLC